MARRSTLTNDIALIIIHVFLRPLSWPRQQTIDHDTNVSKTVQI